MNRTAIALFVLLCVPSVAACAEDQPRTMAKPNIVFILADDLGWADTTLYGQTRYYQTPNLERLARRGMTFTRAYSASPLCSPTRSAILTGLSPARTGITVPNCHLPQVVLQASAGTRGPPGQKAVMPVAATRLRVEYRTLAESLQDAGYATGHFGKWHLGAEPYSPLQQGFEVDLPHHPGPGPAGSYVAPWKFKDFDADPNVPDQHLEDRMAREAVAFMEQHKDAPFFLNYWMFSVHAPFDAKRALVEKHRARVDPADQQRCPTYAAMVESMDDAVGTLLDALDRLKLSDNTILIFTADNGGNMYSEVDGTVPTSNRPLRGGKATMFEGGTRVPCIIAWPGITKAATRSAALVQSEDYYPTLLEGLQLMPADGQKFDGVSLFPVLQGNDAARDAIFQYFPHNPAVPDWLPPAVSTHRGDWKLIRIFHGGDDGAHRHLLFNLREDPGEKQNLAARQPALVQELDTLISRFLAETGAVLPVPNPAFDPAQYHPELEGQPTPKNSASSTGTATADPLQGWKARGCAADVKNGILQVSQLTGGTFLGFAAARHSGPTTVTLRIKAAAGASHFDWLPGGARDKPQTVSFKLAGGGWQELTIAVPATGPLGIVRLYLPKQDEPIEIDWIEIKSAGKVTRTEF